MKLQTLEDKHIAASPDALQVVQSHCCYCSMQCSLDLTVIEGRIKQARPTPGFPVATGKACAKGVVAHEHAQHGERLTAPLLRKQGVLTPVSWEEAMDVLVDRLQEMQRRYGRDAVAVFGGGSLTNEKAYLLGKFARVALGTRNIDYNGRYCMSAAATAMNKAFGMDRGMTVPLSDIPHARFLLIVGANIAECEPTMMPYLREAKGNGAKIVVVDPRRTPTAAFADLHVPIKPGTDLALMNGILHVMIREGWVDQSFIDAHTVGYAEVERTVSAYTPARTEEITGVPAADIERIARWYGEAETAILYTARGIEQQMRGVDNVHSCINLALASGKIGKPGSGFGAVTGQGNGQGGREHGMKADQLPGYRSIENLEHRQFIAEIWNVPEEELPGKGLSAYELMEAAHQGEIRGMFVLASNPATSSPNSNLVKEALRRLEFLAVTDLFLTETAELADLVLPGSAWTEDEGTMTTLEGRVVLRRAAVPPPGEAKHDWRILCAVAERLGRGEFFRFSSTEEIFEELRKASAGGRADYSGISYEKIERQQGVFWPCPDEEHAGTERVFTERFGTPHGKAIFFPVEYRGPQETPDEQRPYYLTNGRVLTHYLTGVQTRRTQALHNRMPVPFVEMHPSVAEAHGVVDGDWVEISTERGAGRFQAKITANTREDTLFVPIHWEHELSINLLTSAALDPESRMPEFKIAAAQLRRLDPMEEGWE